MGHLMRRNILTCMAPPGNEGYDLICIHPDPRHQPGPEEKAQIRLQVKRRYATDGDRGFPGVVAIDGVAARSSRSPGRPASTQRPPPPRRRLCLLRVRWPGSSSSSGKLSTLPVSLSRSSRARSGADTGSPQALRPRGSSQPDRTSAEHGRSCIKLRWNQDGATSVMPQSRRDCLSCSF